MPTKKELLTKPIQHIDIKQLNVVPLVDAMQHMAYSSRDLARAAAIYERMLRDRECGIILCLAGSLISAGLKQIFVDLIRSNMVDAVVSTGANIVDQDFFEALGYRHWIADDLYRSGTEDGTLRELMIDRIYDTLIDEEQLRICDDTTKIIADGLAPRPYSSREFIREMGAISKSSIKRRRRGERTALCSPPMRKTCPSSCPPSVTVRLDSGWSPIAMSAAINLRCRSIRPRISMS